MKKNIILNEIQFKKFVKHNLNEITARAEEMRRKRAELLAKKEKEKADKSILAKQITKKIRDWARDPNCSLAYSEADLYIGDDTTPMTWEDYIEKNGFGAMDSHNLETQLCSKARANVEGKTTHKKTAEIHNPITVSHFKKEGESEEEHKLRNLTSDKKQEYLKNQELHSKDEKFFEDFSELAYNGDERLPRSGNPVLTNDEDFKKVKEYCEEQHIICTNNGEIYMPIKVSREKFHALPEDVRSTTRGIIEASVNNVEKIKFMNMFKRFRPNKWLTFINKGYLGLGGKNKSMYLYCFYVPKDFRNEI